MPHFTSEERLGTKLADKYELQAILGRGGMGTVFRGVHTWTGRPVAVKVLNPAPEGDTSLAERFLREARTATALRHPNVVEVLDMGADEDGTGYLVLELLDGEALSETLKRGSMSLSDAMLLLLPIMDALAIAHDKGFVHRDIKPDNIFLHRGEDALVPKLLDFGIAKALQEGVSNVTRAGAVIGTPHYLSPEQATATNIGPHSDVWAMGVVLYEALCGTTPFQGDSATAVVVKVVTSEAPSLASHGNRFHPHIVQAVDRALARDLSIRYPHMRSFAEALIYTARSIGVPIAVPKGLAKGMDATGQTMSQGGSGAMSLPNPPPSVPAPPIHPTAALAAPTPTPPTNTIPFPAPSGQPQSVPAEMAPAKPASSKGTVIAVVAVLALFLILGIGGGGGWVIATSISSEADEPSPVDSPPADDPPEPAATAHDPVVAPTVVEPAQPPPVIEAPVVAPPVVAPPVVAPPVVAPPVVEPPPQPVAEAHPQAHAEPAHDDEAARRARERRHRARREHQETDPGISDQW